MAASVLNVLLTLNYVLFSVLIIDYMNGNNHIMF